MDKLIKILREQMILCSRLIEIFNGLNNALKDNATGIGVTPSVQAVEPLLKDLSKSEIKIQEFLKEKKVSDLKTFIDMQPEGVERSVSTRLISQVSNLQNQLRRKTVNAAGLLVSSKAFIDFNLNVISQTKASTTYGPPGSEIEHQRKIRMFDASV